MSQPFCVDQLNPAAFSLPYTENYRFILARKIGNLKTNMHGGGRFVADASPMTFTSRSASDFDYDISTEDSSENENENTLGINRLC